MITQRSFAEVAVRRMVSVIKSYKKDFGADAEDESQLQKNINSAISTFCHSLRTHDLNVLVQLTAQLVSL